MVSSHFLGLRSVISILGLFCLVQTTWSRGATLSDGQRLLVRSANAAQIEDDKGQQLLKDSQQVAANASGKANDAEDGFMTLKDASRSSSVATKSVLTFVTVFSLVCLAMVGAIAWRKYSDTSFR